MTSYSLAEEAASQAHTCTRTLGKSVCRCGIWYMDQYVCSCDDTGNCLLVPCPLMRHDVTNQAPAATHQAGTSKPFGSLVRLIPLIEFTLATQEFGRWITHQEKALWRTVFFLVGGKMWHLTYETESGRYYFNALFCGALIEGRNWKCQRAVKQV